MGITSEFRRHRPKQAHLVFHEPGVRHSHYSRPSTTLQVLIVNCASLAASAPVKTPLPEKTFHAFGQRSDCKVGWQMASQLYLQAPWEKVEQQEAFVSELDHEVGPGHPLFKSVRKALAKATDRDDVLFEIDDGKTTRYAVVHLTWSGNTETSPNWPRTRIFDSIPDFVEWMNEDRTGG